MITAAALVLAGGGLVLYGVAAIYPPAAFILAGVGLVAVGLLGVDVHKNGPTS